MSTITKSASAAPRAALVDTLYTLCPVLVASNIAVELGWLDEEFARAGARAIYLRSLPSSGSWEAHFNHDSPSLFRDGGNSPAIHARADLRDTRLIGLTQAQPAGKILVRADASVYRVADLKGRRFALYRSLNDDKIDHRRATSEHGIEKTLAVHGLTRADIEIVDIDDDDDRPGLPAQRPAELWARYPRNGWTLEAIALKEGRVDALFDYSVGGARALEQTGEFKVIEDLDRHPDWTLRIANSPRTISVSAEFADQHPEVVVAFLRASIRAGRWINAHPDAAAELFRRVTVYPDAASIAAALPHYDLVPDLSAQNLAGLQIETDFLHARGYIQNALDVKTWAAPDYLAQALRTL
ncbi:ABC-type nitrate/sulfonate/bicarbonate transport system, periplasmic component [Opitutaceae bacterium TAV1]|nr:ABC-type nitrate/sulfonate/bicarbonate transport system, periplasmic component [Opitutaceae bacterium TAV1]